MKQGKANRVLPRECTGHSKPYLPTTQEKTLHMDITRWSLPKSDWLYSLQSKWRSSIQSEKRKRQRPGAACGSDHELLVAKFILKLKKVGKNTRPFTYDLYQIPDDYTVEATNRFKGLDLTDRVPDELWMEVRDTVEGAVIKTNGLVPNWERVCQGCILSPCLLNICVENIMQNARLDEAQAGIKITQRNINNLRYADDTTLMVESEETK